MITVYHRPKSLEDALEILTQPDAAPLGGGTVLSKQKADSVQAVDLQLLGLDSLARKGTELQAGATLTLQALLESKDCPEAWKPALKLEAPINIRNAATVAGTIVACDGRSPFVTALLALDAKVDVRQWTTDDRPSSTVYGLGDFLPLRPRGLITSITVPLNVKFAFEYVARTPSDSPIVCVAVAGWASGRTRMAVGGYGKSPMLAMDGAYPSPGGRGTEGEGETEGINAAARNAFHEATDDFGSAEYRMDVAATLAKRCVETIRTA